MRRSLVFSGGGVNALAHIGALEVLLPHIPRCNQFVGTSAGALIAMCLAAGASVEFLLEWTRTFDFSSLADWSVFNLMTSWGLCKGKVLEETIRALLTQLGHSPDITFQELYEKTGNYLGVVFTDLSDHSYQLASPGTTPHACVALFVRASASVPLFFNPVIHPKTGAFLVDGGIDANFPVELLENGQLEMAIHLSPRLRRFPPKTWWQYLTALYNALRYGMVNKVFDASTCFIDVHGHSMLNFWLDEKEKRVLLELGRQAMYRKLQDRSRKLSIKNAHFIQ